MTFETLTHQQQLKHLESVARRSLPGWGISSDVPLTLLSLSENATYRLEPGGQFGASPVILRVHRTGYHSLQAIQSELDWMSALQSEAGIVTPQAIPMTSDADRGERIQCIRTPALNETRFVVLFEHIAGAAPDEGQLMAPFYRLGAITAALHEHAIGWQRPRAFERLIWDYDGCLGEHALWGDWRAGPGLTTDDQVVLEKTQATIAGRLQAYGSDQQVFGLIHADLRVANLLEENDNTRVIDFDDAGLGWFLYDLAGAVSFIETRRDLPELVDRWIQGYQTRRVLRVADVAMIPTFIMLRRMTLLAWIGSHSETELARTQGNAFTQDTRRLADQYLNNTLLCDLSLWESDPQPEEDAATRVAL